MVLVTVTHRCGSVDETLKSDHSNERYGGTSTFCRLPHFEGKVLSERTV